MESIINSKNNGKGQTPLILSTLASKALWLSVYVQPSSAVIQVIP